MTKAPRTACFLLTAVLLFPAINLQRVFPQEKDAGKGAAETRAEAKTIPDALRRPYKGEAPRYPQDLVIGELGRGKAPEGAWVFAVELLEALITGNESANALKRSLPVLSKSLREKISEIEARSYRLGGGRVEADGNVSFLLRFLGQAGSISGELFARKDDEWILDDIILEEKKALGEVKDSYRFDFSPYERFF